MIAALCWYQWLNTDETTLFFEGLFNVWLMCGSRKYPHPHHRGSLEIPRRRGVFKPKMFKGKYEPKLEFPKGWGSNQKNPSVGRVWIFSGTTQWVK